MPDSLEQLDLLLLTVAQSRRIQRDGIHFQGWTYIDLTLAAYVGEEVTVRYDPRDMAEIRVFYQNRFLCRAICPELAGATIHLRELLQARRHRRRERGRQITERQAFVDTLVGRRSRRSTMPEISGVPDPASERSASPTHSRLKRYFND